MTFIFPKWWSVDCFLWGNIPVICGRWKSLLAGVGKGVWHLSVWQQSLIAAGHGSGWTRLQLHWVNWLIGNWVAEIPVGRSWTLQFWTLPQNATEAKWCPHHKVDFLPPISLCSAVLLDTDSVVNHLDFCKGILFPWNARHCISWSFFTI